MCENLKTKLPEDAVIEKCIEDAFECHIFTRPWDHFGTPMCDIEGKQAFLDDAVSRIREAAKDE
jgi:hypothetical protein